MKASLPGKTKDTPEAGKNPFMPNRARGWKEPFMAKQTTGRRLERIPTWLNRGQEGDWKGFLHDLTKDMQEAGRILRSLNIGHAGSWKGILHG